ncbi:MAG: hypothetical protein WC815_22895 [Vicinamibacterales bacterium]|jgi:hypothetical protein
MLLAALLVAAAASPSYSRTPSPQDVSGLEAVYQAIDSQPKLTLAEQYEQKMKVLNATIEAGNAYTSAFEDLATYTEIARETGSFLTPGFGAKLQEFQSRLEDATKNRAFDAFGKVSKASAYATQAVGLISEVDAILGDPNLTPAGRRSLVALKGLGVAMQSFGEKIPGIGKGLELLGQMTSELTGAVRGTAKNVVDLRGGTFAPSEEQRQGLDAAGGFGFIRTSLYDQGLPVVQELINEKKDERTLLQTAPGKWREVKYDEVSAIWSEYRFANGRGPTPSEVVTLLDSPVLRARLLTKASVRAQEKHADRLIEQFALPGVNRSNVLKNEDELQGILQTLGLVTPKNSAAFNELLKRRLTDPRLDDPLLKRMAIAAHPLARDYFKWRGVDPDAMSLDALAQQLIEYRVSGSTQYAAHLRATAAASKTAGTTADATAKAALDQGLAKVQAERKTPPVTPPQPDPPGLEACLQPEKGLYEVNIRSRQAIKPDGTQAFSCWRSAFSSLAGGQEWGPKACCDALNASLAAATPGSAAVNAAWFQLQVCSWDALIAQRLDELNKKRAECLKKLRK